MPPANPALAPVLDEIASEKAGQVKVAKTNVDENPALAQRYHIQGIPTFILFQSGREAGRASGAMPAAQIERAVGFHAGPT